MAKHGDSQTRPERRSRDALVSMLASYSYEETGPGISNYSDLKAGLLMMYVGGAAPTEAIRHTPTSVLEPCGGKNDLQPRVWLIF